MRYAKCSVLVLTMVDRQEGAAEMFAGDRIPFMSALNAWNFLIGFGLMVAGLVMSMRWR